MTKATEQEETPARGSLGNVASRLGSALTGAARSAGRAVADAAAPRAKIVAFKLPTSPGQNDYCFVFDLDEVFDLLHRRLTLRPQFEVWTADGIVTDTDHLGRELWVNFVHQYEEERDAAFDARFSEMEELEKEITTIDDRHSKVTEERKNLSILVTLGMSLAALVFAFLSIPLIIFVFGSGFVLLILAAILGWWARRRGKRWLRLLEEQEELEKQRKGLQRQYSNTERQLHSEMKRLETAFNLTHGRYQNGSFEITARRHPQIVALARDIFNLAQPSVAPDSKLEEELTAPDVYPFLQTDFYLRWVPESLHARLQEWIDQEVDRQAIHRYQSTVRSLEFLGSEE